MPPLSPFIVSGVVTDLDGSSLLSDCKVVIKNFSNGKSSYATTNGLGEYVIDMANSGGEVVENDVLRVKLLKRNKVKVFKITVTESMVSDGGTTQDLTVTDVRVHVYNVFRDLLKDSLPPDYEDARGSTIGWSVLSAFPEKSPVFPCIVINPVSVSLKFVSLDKGQDDNDGSVSLEYFGLSKDRKEIIDQARGFVENVILDGLDLLAFSGVSLKSEWLDDSNVGMVLWGEQKINTANQTIMFWWRP